MFSHGGYSYVYFIYGNHYCFNVVTGPKEKASAVLIRALEPINGIDLMKKRRKKERLKDLTSGPGKLTQALGIDLTHNRLLIGDSKIKIYEDGCKTKNIKRTSRIGISKGQDLLYRWLMLN